MAPSQCLARGSAGVLALLDNYLTVHYDVINPNRLVFRVLFGSIGVDSIRIKDNYVCPESIR